MSSLKISILDSGYLLSHITPTDHKRYGIESKTTLIRTIHELLGINPSAGEAAEKEELQECTPEIGTEPAAETKIVNQRLTWRNKHLITPATEISCQQPNPPLLREAEPFDWREFPENRIGKTTYHLDEISRTVRIMRDGYTCCVYTELAPLIHLRKHPEQIGDAIRAAGIKYMKSTVLRGFITDALDSDGTLKVPDETKMPEPEPEFFREADKFDHEECHRAAVGNTLYFEERESNKKLLWRKDTRGHTVCVTDEQVEQMKAMSKPNLLMYTSKLSKEKQKILIGYIEDLKDEAIGAFPKLRRNTATKGDYGSGSDDAYAEEQTETETNQPEV